MTLSYLAGAGWQFFTNNGDPLSGGLLYTYAAGTTTPQTTYTSLSGATANTNPIVLDAAGRPPAEIWLADGSSFKFVLKDATGVQIGSYDNIIGVNDTTAIYAALANTTDVTKGDALIGFKQSNSSGALSGAVGRTVHQKLQELVSVKDFGATGDGTTDDTAAIQAAFGSGAHLYIPAGTYLIKDAVRITTSNQIIYGDGSANSVFKINNTFNMSATGVIVFQVPTQYGPRLQDLGIVFTQPDTATRASLTSYPVAISAVDTPRFQIQNVRITNATNGIDMTGNCGGSFIDLLEMSAYGTGIKIDGSLDTVRINKFHFWNFSMTTNQASIFYTNPTRAFDIGMCDGVFIHEFLNISNLGMNLRTGTVVSGDPWVYVSDSGFDTNNGILQSAGSLQVSNSYITVKNAADLNGVITTGGWAQFVNCKMFAGSTNQSLVLLQNETDGSISFDQCHFLSPIAGIPYINKASTVVSNTSLQIANSFFQIGNVDAYVITAATPSSGVTMIHFINNIIHTTPNAAYSNAMFKISSGNRMYMSGNRAVDKGTNAAVFILINADDFNWVSGNIAPGWTNTFPTPTQGYYLNNLV